MKTFFQKFSHQTAAMVGSHWSFVGALVIIILWGATGSRFHYSDTWQLFINTGTTIVTFLMVFLIQNTQNRDAKAIQLKLDELIRADKEARNALIDLEDVSDDEIFRLEREFALLREQDSSLHKSLKAVEHIIKHRTIRAG